MKTLATDRPKSLPLKPESKLEGEFCKIVRGVREPVPDHSWLSRTRTRLPLEVHDAVFTWVLQRLAERGLVKGERIGVDASTVEANAALPAR